ncbi:hypothetical protein L1049_012281 [Liquidambar formosana]|uniref:Uncharacterized protein n=1 Tax=Liquidambar formosana TaxID=63359 RepID=A0AAP0RT08_LIQFO
MTVSEGDNETWSSMTDVCIGVALVFRPPPAAAAAAAAAATPAAAAAASALSILAGSQPPLKLRRHSRRCCCRSFLLLRLLLPRRTQIDPTRHCLPSMGKCLNQATTRAKIGSSQSGCNGGASESRG